MKKKEFVKVVFLGESKVGKTSIFNRYSLNKFDPEIPSTFTAEFFKKAVFLPDNSSLTFDMWDNPGLERYRDIPQVFYKGAKVFILVYDPTNNYSFQELKEYWYNEIKDINAIIVVVANKSDLFMKTIRDEEGKRYAESIGAIFASVSAKDNIGISQLFQKIGMVIKKVNK